MEYKMNSVLIRSMFLLICCFIVTCKSKPVQEDIFVSSYEGNILLLSLSFDVLNKF